MNDNLNGRLVAKGITFDDVLLIPNKSNVLPNQVDLKTKLTNKISLNIPFIASAMDTVTESEMAIEMALLGGVGVVHKNLAIEEQANEIKKVKEYKTDLTNFPNANLDTKKQLIVGAAVSTTADLNERVAALVKAEIDFVVLDSAHGHSMGIINAVKSIKNQFPNLELIAGNIATKEAAKDLHEAGVDGVKVGIGPGSICTTRVVAGIGVPQISALADVYEYCSANNLPFIADGGIKYSGDVVKALGIGANSVMLGSTLAGTAQTPGKVITVNQKQYKSYVGMGSLVAMKRGSSDRYFQDSKNKLVPEGIESLVEYKGEVSDVIFQLVGGLRSGMGYTGSENIDQLRTNAKFIRISSAGLVESHPHNVQMVGDAPNYKK